MTEQTMIQPETGEILYRDIRPFEFTFRGEKITIDMPGWYPKNKNDDDGIFTQEDMKISDNALRTLKARYQQNLQDKSFDFGNVVSALVIIPNS